MFSGNVPEVLSLDLIHAVFDQFRLDLIETHHGPHHWARVLENGLAMAERNGANKNVVALFALFHDSCRENENDDPGHGPRGAALAKEMLAGKGIVTDEELQLLKVACKGHTHQLHNQDITVGTCWDADRLDLLRVGITPNPTFFSTLDAREPEMMKWANRRSSKQIQVPYVDSHWLGLYI
jgi:uncharacterized protein